VVVSVLSAGAKLRDSVGDVELIEWDELAMAREIHDGEVAPMIGPLLAAAITGLAIPCRRKRRPRSRPPPR
jgi:hypothetical protein